MELNEKQLATLLGADKVTMKFGDVEIVKGDIVIVFDVRRECLFVNGYKLERVPLKADDI